MSVRRFFFGIPHQAKQPSPSDLRAGFFRVLYNPR